MHTARPWPDLPYHAWCDTRATLHLWTQIVGKTRLALTPWLNHGWQVPLYVTARGLGTSPIPIPGGILEIEFDFVRHRLLARTSLGGADTIPLESQPVAVFYGRMMAMLARLDVTVAIHELPNEVEDPIPFSEDMTHAAYDGAAVHRFWQALVPIDTIFKRFRTGFLGKASPVHVFWGSFDLAATRYSGRPAPLHPGGVPGLPDDVVREAYSHEECSAGFWPGDDSFPRAAFYAYAYPEPDGFRDRSVTPGTAYDASKGEFILPYATVRTAEDPEALLLDFLSTTYAAAADAGNWDRKALDCSLGEPGRVRRF